jgi:hypothetical protein
MPALPQAVRLLTFGEIGRMEAGLRAKAPPPCGEGLGRGEPMSG